MNQKNNLYTRPAAVVLLALICCALWGSAFPAVKQGFVQFNVVTDGDKILFAGCRFFLAGVALLTILSLAEGRLLSVKRSSLPLIFGQGVLQTTVQYICFYIGLAATTGSKASVINGSSTFFAILAAHFLVKGERITLRKGAGCLLGFAGIVVVNLGGGELLGNLRLSGEGMILLCTAAYGVSSVTLKMISRREAPGTITAYQMLFGGGLLIVLGLLFGGEISGLSLRSVLLMGYLVLISSVAFFLWSNLLKHNPVSRVTIFGFTIPVFGVLFSAIFLGEPVFTLTNLVALLLVSAGIVVVSR